MLRFWQVNVTCLLTLLGRCLFKFFLTIWFNQCLCLLGRVKVTYLIREKISWGKFSSGKNFVTSEKLVTFPWLIFQIRHSPPANFWNYSNFHEWNSFFFQRKVVLLVLDLSNCAWRSALLVSLIHIIGCCKYTLSWIPQNQKFLYKLIFPDYNIFRRISEEF